MNILAPIVTLACPEARLRLRVPDIAGLGKGLPQVKLILAAEGVGVRGLRLQHDLRAEEQALATWRQAAEAVKN